MENLGFIRDKLDIKILILYILDRLPGPVEPSALEELVLFDGGFTWFDYSDCLAYLVDSGHVTHENGQYEITEQGRRNVGYVGSSLPYSVRAKADRLTAPVAAAMRRSSMIETVAEKNGDGSSTVSLRLSDGVGEIISIRLIAPNEETAESMEKRFREDAETICNKIILLLTQEQ